MNIRSHLPRSVAALCLAAGIGLAAEANAEAALVFFYPGADFSSTPYTISFGGGLATYTFTDISSTSTDPLAVDAVSTGGTGMVNAFGAPVSFQLGSVIGDTGYPFAAFPTAAGIAFSLAETSIGLEFSLPDGVHYGFATTLGPEVVAYGFNSTPGGFIATTGVPEPATWVLLIAGLGAVGAVASLRKIRAPQTASL
jgi:hypothetical protein